MRFRDVSRIIVLICMVSLLFKLEANQTLAVGGLVWGLLVEVLYAGFDANEAE